MGTHQDEKDRLTAALADRYTIEEEVDSGGMAIVYRARDLKHDRTVAIKVLKPDLAEAIGGDRFLREIRTTANLSHPHILPLFDSGDAEGFLYYVMPFVEGESLQDRLDREGQLPIEDAVQIAREVADALAYAHKKGVIHRDIKPANIMLDEGHALLADFGIAQARAGAEETKLTGSGMSLGTPSYMSPEQVSGDKGLDGRADQYALACVLYEMLAGHPPFEGADIQSVMRQHLAVDAPGLTGARATVPKGVAKAAHRALAKAPADRFRTMGEFEKALAGATLPLLARIPLGRARVAGYAVLAILGLVMVAMIASRGQAGGPDYAADRVLVLPFANETGDTAYDTDALILSNLIINYLDGEAIAGVIPYAAVKGTLDVHKERATREPGLDPRAETVAELRAGTVVSGSLFRQGDSLRVVPEVMSGGGAQRIMPIAPVVLPSDHEELSVGFALVAERVLVAVAWHLDPGWDHPTSTTGITAPPSRAVMEAYDGAYEAWGRRDWQGSLTEAERAVALDPTYLPAKTLLADIHSGLGNFSEADSLLDELAESYDQLAPQQRNQWEVLRAELDGDLQGAYVHLKEGDERFGTPVGKMALGGAALSINRPKEALEAVTAVDPQSPTMITTGSWTRLCYNHLVALHLLEDHRGELREVRRLREWQPEWIGFLIAEIRARAALGQAQEVSDLVEEAFRTNPVPGGAASYAAFFAARELQAHGHGGSVRAFAERGLEYLKGLPPEVARTPAHRDLLAGTLWILGRWDEAYTIAEGLVQEDPSDVDFLTSLGALQAMLGRREEAVQTGERIAALEIPYDRGQSTLGLARIAAALGDREEAVSLLGKAHEQGWPFSINDHTDLYLESLWGYPPFEEFLRPKG